MDDDSVSDNSSNDLHFETKGKNHEESDDNEAKRTGNSVRTHSLCCDPLEEVQCEYFAQVSGNLCFKRSAKQQVVPDELRMILA